MKYLLRPLDNSYPEIWFDTNSITDLARLGALDEDVIYVGGCAYHAPIGEMRPSTRIATTYVRELEADVSRLSFMVQSAVKNNYGSVAGEDGKLYMMIAADDFETMDSFVDSLESAKEDDES